MNPGMMRLFRLPLALMNGIAALAGYCLVPGPRSGMAMLAACAGVTLLAMGGTAINQVLERDLDALMLRTRLRPLPVGAISPPAASCLGCGSILAGCMVLFAGGGLLPVLLGLAVLVWYLAVYTPLKRRTSLALPLGALCGAVPPLIGWVLAGGGEAGFSVIALSGLFFVWQVPHFWLLQKCHADDYRRAGIPLLAIRRGMFGLWLLALAAMALMLPAFGVVGHHLAYGYVPVISLVIVLALYRYERPHLSYLNLVPVLVTLALFIR